MLSDAEAEFSSLPLFPWDDELYWVVSTEALASRVWQCIMGVEDVDLAKYGTIDEKQAFQVAALAKG